MMRCFAPHCILAKAKMPKPHPFFIKTTTTKISTKIFQKFVDKKLSVCYSNKVNEFGGLAQLARASALQAEGHRFESYNPHQ